MNKSYKNNKNTNYQILYGFILFNFIQSQHDI